MQLPALWLAIPVASTIAFMEGASLFEQVSQFVSKETAYPLRDISLETSLTHDIRLAGDDADDFFIAFAEKFNVDPDSLRYIDFVMHFGHEEEFMWSGCVVASGILITLLVGSAFGLSFWLSGPLALPIICLCFYLITKMMSAKRNDGDDITVADLVRAAEMGQWPPPPVTGRELTPEERKRAVLRWKSLQQKLIRAKDRESQ